MNSVVARTCTEIFPKGWRAIGSGNTGSRSEPISVFRAKSAYVLLGDPGSGKTTEFERECSAMGDAAVLVTARDFITFDVDSCPEWRGKTLFIDGLDEVRAGGADARAPLDDIRRRLDRLERPDFRISCREADWLGCNDWQNLKAVSPDSEVAVLRLNPLSEQAARELLLSELADTSSQEAGAFMVQAQRRGVGSMLDNPLTLKLLTGAVAHPHNAGWPESRLETFGMACRRMANECNYEHRAASAAVGTRRLPQETLMSAAGYLCAVLLLCDIDSYRRAPGETLADRHLASGRSRSDIDSYRRAPGETADFSELLDADRSIALDDLVGAALGSGEDIGLLRGAHYIRGGFSAAPGGGDELAVLEHALASKLFTAVREGVFEPRHRQIAEFLAGRYLAERIADSGSGLPAGRVIPLMTSTSDGGVPTPLRGLSAWLAAHSSLARGRLIDIDPVGVGLYGDITSFTSGEKERLLRSLGACAEKEPLFGHQRNGGMTRGQAGSIARAFRPLASADMAAAARSLLASRGVTTSDERFTEFLARVLSQAEESELGKLADLSPELLAVLRDPVSSPSVKAAALEAYTRIAPTGAGKTRELRQLLEEVHGGVFPDPQGEIRRILLRRLYPHEVTPSQVWRYAIIQNHNPLSGHFWKFLHRDILALSDDSQARELLTSLHEYVRRPAAKPHSQAADGQENQERQLLEAVEQQHSPILNPSGLGLLDIPIKLLERVLSAYGDDLDTSLLYDWLNTVRAVSKSPLTKDAFLPLRNIRVWFEARPQVQKAIYRTWLERSGESDRAWAWLFEHSPYDAMHGSRPSAELGLWCLKKAVEVFDADIGAAMVLLEGARKSLEVIDRRGEGEAYGMTLFEGAPESLELVCRRGGGPPFRVALLEGIDKPLKELSLEEQFIAAERANLRLHGRETLAWQTLAWQTLTTGLTNGSPSRRSHQDRCNSAKARPKSLHSSPKSGKAEQTARSHEPVPTLIAWTSLGAAQPHRRTAMSHLAEPRQPQPCPYPRLSHLAHSAVVAVLAAVLAAVPVAAQNTAAQNTATALSCGTTGTEQFSDVTDSDYAAAYILCAKALQITKGTEDGTFKPQGTLTRAQMAAFLARLWSDALEKPCPAQPAHNFTDTADSFAADDIACIYALGVTKGTTDTAYSPTATLTTAQVTRFITRILNKTKPGTCDLTGSELQQAAICLAELNIAPNTTEAIATTPAPRAQVMVYLIGAWHHAADKGRPPAPPAKTVIAQQYAYTAITAGYTHSCAVRVDKTAVCWGYDDGGGRTDAPPGQFTAITAGSEHSCALGTDDTAVCWGNNGSGQTDAPHGKFTAITAGTTHSCALRTDNTAVCWGWNLYGRTDAPAGQFTAITAGSEHSCAVRVDKTAVCWGNNGSGQTDAPQGEFIAITAGGFHTCAVRVDKTAVCWGNNGSGQTDAPQGEFVAITVGNFHSCGLRTDNTAVCWGWNLYGQADAPPGQFTAIAASSSYSCAIRTDNTAVCWGDNEYGQGDVPAD